MDCLLYVYATIKLSGNNHLTKLISKVKCIMCRMRSIVNPKCVIIRKDAKPNSHGYYQRQHYCLVYNRCIKSYLKWGVRNCIRSLHLICSNCITGMHKSICNTCVYAATHFYERGLSILCLCTT